MSKTPENNQQIDVPTFQEWIAEAKQQDLLLKESERLEKVVEYGRVLTAIDAAEKGQKCTSCTYYRHEQRGGACYAEPPRWIAGTWQRPPVKMGTQACRYFELRADIAFESVTEAGLETPLTQEYEAKFGTPAFNG